MKIERIYYSTHFANAFKKLSAEIRKKAVKQEKIFRKNPFDPKLKTHKLKGALSEYWSFSIDYSHRILFEFYEDGSVGFIDAGLHSIYQ